MSFRSKIYLTLNYFKNAYRMLLLNSLGLVMSVFLVFSVSNLSTSLINYLNIRETTDYLLNLNDSANVGLSKADVMRFNELFEGAISLSLLSNDLVLTVTLENQNDVEMRIGGLIDDPRFADLRQRFMVLSEHTAASNALKVGDRVYVASRVYTIIAVEGHEFDAWLHFSELNRLSYQEESVADVLMMKVHRVDVFQEGMRYIDGLMVNHQTYYSAEKMDFSEVLIQIIKLVRNFLFAVSAMIFFVSIFLIRNIVIISAMERRDEMVILRCFGLSKKESQSLLVLEIVVLVFLVIIVGFAASSAFIFSFVQLLKIPFSMNSLTNLAILGFILVVSYFSTKLAAHNLNRFELNDLD